jgi:integrase
MFLDIRGDSYYYSDMASVWKHPRSRFWTACFTDGNCKQRKRSTKTVDRKLALRLADQFEQVGRRKRTARQVRRVIADLYRDITREDLPFVSVRSFVRDWLARKRPETSSATHVFYTSATRKFLTFLGADADRELSDITADHVLRFRNFQATTLSSKTVNNGLKCIRMVFKSARRDGLIGDDPTEFVDTVRKTGAADRRPFTIPELKAVLAVADEEWRSLILFGFYTGQRLSDLASLTWQNIDLRQNQLRLVTRKTGRRIIQAIALPLLAHIETMNAGDDPNAPLHPRAAAILARQGRTSSLSNQFADLLAQAGLREKKNHKRRAEGRSGRHRTNELSFHCLRRTATTLLHEAGIPAAVTQELIGHDSEEIHRVYVNVGMQALERAATALPDIR